MRSEKLIRLEGYVQDLKNKLSSPVPSKHEGHSDTYKQYLHREIEQTEKRIESLKLEGGGGGK